MKTRYKVSGPKFKQKGTGGEQRHAINLASSGRLKSTNKTNDNNKQNKSKLGTKKIKGKSAYFKKRYLS